MSDALIEVRLADYANPDDARAVVDLLDAYARDPFGGDCPLESAVRTNLVAALARQPGAFSLLALVDSVPVGLANCFTGFSTFRCLPLINIHDLVVLPEFRGRRLAQGLMALVEQIAVQRGCCKVTLEVLQGNPHAQQVYTKMGYAGYQLDATHGQAMLWQKKLTPA
ncbi:MAG: GNAT family N-acetyltransferase [Pseudomonadota bacterium]|nr:GNAT family N-acetyltransferase [Pseudomonadota bacterium]